MTPANGVPVDRFFEVDRPVVRSNWLKREQEWRRQDRRRTAIAVALCVLLAGVCALVAVGVATGYGL